MVARVKAYMPISERHVVFLVSPGKRHIMILNYMAAFFLNFFKRIAKEFNKRWI